MKSIERKITVVQERVERLRRLSQKVPALVDYLASQDIKDVAERNLQVAIEACLDIGKIIISLEHLDEPPDNKGIFTVLAQAGIVGGATLGFLVPMAGTRNILIHGYDKVDDTLVYGVLKKHLGDFLSFLREVKVNYLEKASDNQSDTSLA